MPPYGGSIAQNVYYADDTLCDSNVNTKKGYPTRPDKSAWKAPYILMVDRGDCTFVQKVSKFWNDYYSSVESLFFLIKAFLFHYG